MSVYRPLKRISLAQWFQSEQPSSTITPKVRFRTLEISAHHEASHAVIAISVGRPFRFVSIVPIDKRGRRSLGRVDYDTDYDDARFLPYDKIALSTLAGVHGQRRFAPRSPWRHDAQGDHKIVRTQIRKKLGLAGKRAAEKLAELDVLSAQAVANNWPDIVKVAGALIENRTMTEDEVRLVIGRRPRTDPDAGWFTDPLDELYGGDDDDERRTEKDYE